MGGCRTRFVFESVRLLGTAWGSSSSRTTAWGSFGTGVSLLTNWGQQITGAAIPDDAELFWVAGNVETAGMVVLDGVGDFFPIN